MLVLDIVYIKFLISFIKLLGDSAENSPFGAIGNVLKKIFCLPVWVGLLSNTLHNLSLYITTGLEIKTFAGVHINLELSVNEKFAPHGTMVKVLATLKSPCAKACYLIQKLEPAIEKMCLPQCFCNKFFFHNMTSWIFESSKK